MLQSSGKTSQITKNFRSPSSRLFRMHHSAKRISPVTSRGRFQKLNSRMVQNSESNFKDLRNRPQNYQNTSQLIKKLPNQEFYHKMVLKSNEKLKKSFQSKGLSILNGFVDEYSQLTILPSEKPYSNRNYNSSGSEDEERFLYNQIQKLGEIPGEYFSSTPDQRLSKNLKLFNNKLKKIGKKDEKANFLQRKTRDTSPIQRSFKRTRSNKTKKLSKSPEMPAEGLLKLIERTKSLLKYYSKKKVKGKPILL